MPDPPASKQDVEALSQQLRNITHLLTGNPARRDDGGLVEEVTDLQKALSDFKAKFEGLDIKQFKDDAAEYRDFRKHLLWFVGIVTGGGMVLWAILLNMSKIQDFFHH